MTATLVEQTYFLRPHEEFIEISDDVVKTRNLVRLLAYSTLGLTTSLATITFGSPLFGHFLLAMILAWVASAIILHNTSQWTAEECCCNLMRTYPAYCTKTCGGYPRSCCCARTSTLLLATSILSFLSIVAGWMCSYNMDRMEKHEQQSTGGTPLTTAWAAQNSSNMLTQGEVGLEFFPSLLILVCLSGVLAALSIYVRKLEFALPDIRLPARNKMVVRTLHSDHTVMPISSQEVVSEQILTQPVVGVVVKEF